MMIPSTKLTWLVGKSSFLNRTGHIGPFMVVFFQCFSIVFGGVYRYMMIHTVMLTYISICMVLVTDVREAHGRTVWIFGGIEDVERRKPVF